MPFPSPLSSISFPLRSRSSLLSSLAAVINRPLSSLPIEVGRALRLGVWGRTSSPSGSGQSPAAKCILVHFRHKFAPFWSLNAEITCVYCPLKESFRDILVFAVPAEKKI